MTVRRKKHMTVRQKKQWFVFCCLLLIVEIVVIMLFITQNDKTSRWDMVIYNASSKLDLEWESPEPKPDFYRIIDENFEVYGETTRNSHRLENLKPGTYYFGVKSCLRTTKLEVEQCSAISNVVGPIKIN